MGYIYYHFKSQLGLGLGLGLGFLEVRAGNQCHGDVHWGSYKIGGLTVQAFDLILVLGKIHGIFILIFSFRARVRVRFRLCFP